MIYTYAYTIFTQPKIIYMALHLHFRVLSLSITLAPTLVATLTLTLVWHVICFLRIFILTWNVNTKLYTCTTLV
jgi:hypothetical protein